LRHAAIKFLLPAQHLPASSRCSVTEKPSAGQMESEKTRQPIKVNGVGAPEFWTFVKHHAAQLYD
jgi:hypothetical protein